MKFVSDEGENIRLSFSREECEYTKFNIENHKITFDTDGSDGVLISIPFTDSTPQCIKDRLNDLLYQEMNKHLEEVECMLYPRDMLLNARMQVSCFNDEEFDSQYFISIVVSDLITEENCIEIDKTVNLFSESSKFLNEFVSYCQYELNKILFPFR